jgi:DNA-binding transcriptional MocR family regulator
MPVRPAGGRHGRVEHGVPDGRAGDVRRRDEVILLAPYYFNHEMAVGIAGCRAVAVPTDGAYQPRVDAIAAAVTPRTRAVVTVSPNNPTGAVYPEATLRAINALCAGCGLYHLHDEAYEYFVYDRPGPGVRDGGIAVSATTRRPAAGTSRRRRSPGASRTRSRSTR